MPSGRLVLATRNADKLVEIRGILGMRDGELKSLLDFPEFAEIEETGSTLEENALIKAVVAFRMTPRSPVVPVRTIALCKNPRLVILLALPSVSVRVMFWPDASILMPVPPVRVTPCKVTVESDVATLVE